MAWADTQRAAQSVYSAASREVSNAVSDIGNTYQQILTSGVPASSSREAMNMEIADSVYEPSAEDWKEYEAYRDQTTPDMPEQEQGIEPER
jgi:hypothetical protein